MESGFVRAALARGDVAFGAFDGDQLIAYVWRPFGAAPDADGLWVKVDPPHHYAYKAFTLPAYRASASTSPFRSFPTTIFQSPSIWCLIFNRGSQDGKRAQRRSLNLYKEVDARVGQIQGDERKDPAGCPEPTLECDQVHA